VTPELVVVAHASLGEGPLWDPERKLLWWVDILGGIVHAFDPASGQDQAIEVGQAVGAVVLRRDGSLFVFAENAILTLEPATGRISTALEFPVETPRRRSNDAKADPSGRVWFGRMTWDHAPGAASLCRLDADMTISTLFEGLAIPNGMAWTADGRTMYFAESASQKVFAYDFDANLGSPTAAREFYDVSPVTSAVPDGLTLDAEGCMWLGTWTGRSVVRISPAGEMIDRIELPVSQVTSCAFGGPDLADLYITTAREDFTADDDVREPLAGCLFRVRPGVRGLPPNLAF
jgi:sugar lactone lactonase YvrE